MTTRLLCLLVVCVGWVCAKPQAAAEVRPNILFIYTDDQGEWTTGFSGNTEAHTPHMDRIAREGARFPNAFVTTPVCSPSRATLMTGRYASELGIHDWINPRGEPKHGLDPKWPVWPRLLNKAGYTTGLVGKWHLGTAPKFHPTKFGYSYFMGQLEGGCATKDPRLEEDGESRKFTGLTVDILTDRALRFIERNRDGPFALSVHYRAPHEAFLPVADEDMAHHAKLDPTVPSYPGLTVDFAKKKTRDYYASISSIDRNVGRLLAKLDESKLTDNTVVIFTSDHGYNIGHHGLRYKGNAFWMVKPTPPKKWQHIPAARRPNMFDTSLRVPLAVRWPGVVKPDTVIEQTVDNTDWFPTLLAMAGVALPKDVTVRGSNMVPLLKGQPAGWDDGLYAEYNMRHGATTAMRVIRTPKWKLMRDLQHPGREAFYDLTADPAESRPLGRPNTGQAGAAYDRLETMLMKQAANLDDPLIR